MLFEWLLFLALCFRLSNESEENFGISYLLRGPEDGDERNRPEVDDWCSIKQDSDHQLLVICPNDVNCFVKTYCEGKLVIDYGPPYVADVDKACEAIEGMPLPVGKKKQIESVLRILRLSKETECEFGSIQSLEMKSNGLVNVGQLGRGNCGMDKEERKKCPYRLKLLDLSWNRIERLSNDSFCQFRQLEHLIMDHCGLSHLEDHAFVHLANLKVVILGHNNLTHLPIILFAANVNLQSLILKYNKLRTNSLKAIVPISSLQYLFLQNNRISLSDEPLIFPPNLKWLHLNRNTVEKIGLELINLKNLTDLMMDNNNISHIDERAFQNMPEVKRISLSGNAIEKLEPETFLNNLKLETLNLVNNQLMELPAIAHISGLKYFYASGNWIKSVKKPDVINCTRLNVIDLSNNRLSYIDNGAFSNVNRLQTLILSDNRLSELSADFTLSNIFVLYLSANNFSKFTFDIFPPTLTKLFLSSNNIDTIDKFDERNSTWNLSFLDLSFNRIDSIDNLTLPSSMIDLFLVNNRIREFDPPFLSQNPPLPNLRSVYLQNNNVSRLCDSLYRNRSIISVIDVYVSGNPIDCDCKSPRAKSPFAIKDLHLLKCN